MIFFLWRMISEWLVTAKPDENASTEPTAEESDVVEPTAPVSECATDDDESDSDSDTDADLENIAKCCRLTDQLLMHITAARRSE